MSRSCAAQSNVAGGCPIDNAHATERNGIVVPTTNHASERAARCGARIGIARTGNAMVESRRRSRRCRTRPECPVRCSIIRSRSARSSVFRGYPRVVGPNGVRSRKRANPSRPTSAGSVECGVERRWVDICAARARRSTWATTSADTGVGEVAEPLQNERLTIARMLEQWLGARLGPTRRRRRGSARRVRAPRHNATTPHDRRNHSTHHIHEPASRISHLAQPVERESNIRVALQHRAVEVGTDVREGGHNRNRRLRSGFGVIRGPGTIGPCCLLAPSDAQPRPDEDRSV